MAKTMDQVVQSMLGAQQLQIAALTIQVEDLTEQLTIAKQAKDAKAPLPFPDANDLRDAAEGNR